MLSPAYLIIVMNDSKRVSVVMATYNGEPYLQEQLDSIVAQTYPVHELIIQDDGSSDRTVDIARSYELRYPFVHVFVNEQNLGFQENFRTAVMRATGDFVALSDQDDVWFPEKIAKQVEAIGSCAICYSQHLRGADREHAHVVTYKCAPERQLFAAFVGHSLLMRRDFAQDPDNWLGYMTYDIGLSLLAHFRGGVAYVAEPLNWHRSHDDSASTKIQLDMYRQQASAPTWQPYVYGWSNYRNLQKKASWQRFHQRMQKESEEAGNGLVSKLCRLMLSKNPFALLQLCWVCMRHRATIYPSETKGLSGLIHGFFFPFIHTYHCTFYDV